MAQPHPISNDDLTALLYGTDRRLVSARKLSRVFDVSLRQGRTLFLRLLDLPQVDHEPGPNGQTWITEAGSLSELQESPRRITGSPSTPPLKGGGVCPAVSDPLSYPPRKPLTDAQRSALLTKIKGPQTQNKHTQLTTQEHMTLLGIPPQPTKHRMRQRRERGAVRVRLYHGTARADWAPHVGAWLTDCRRLAKAHALANAIIEGTPGKLIQVEVLRQLGSVHLRRTSITRAYCEQPEARCRGDCGDCGHSQFEVRTVWALRWLKVRSPVSVG